MGTTPRAGPKAKEGRQPPNREQARRLFFPTEAGWRRWLAKNWRQQQGEWLLVAKKTTTRGVHYAQALEEALCWGWIDSQLTPHDGQYFALWFCPRRPGSAWSAANRAAALRLVREGRMQPGGLARIREAQASGRWEKAYSSAAPPRLPPDARRALQEAGALEAFRRLSPSRRLQLVHWVTEAKRPETRRRRVAELPRLLRGNSAQGPGREQPGGYPSSRSRLP